MSADLHRHLDGSLRPATVAAEICEDALADGVDTLEIRFAPQLHGSDPALFIDAALDGIAGRAGLIVCGLYGEDPAALLRLVDLAADRGVVGLDLAGGPAPSHRWRLANYAAPFRRAADRGLGRTVHAGEGRPPAEIRVAIEVLGANRIGHGTTLLDDPSVVELVVEKGIVIEACLTSNVHVGAVARVEEHPLPRWLDRGVKACVCTDNTLLSAVALSGELVRARAIPGMTDEGMARMGRIGREAAFSG